MVNIYANACAANFATSVPYNLPGFLSYQYAHTGNAYIGLDMLNHPGPSEFRTYVQTKLKDSLKNNRSYYVEFYTSRTNCARFACNNISMVITNNQIWADTTTPTTALRVINANAQVYNYGNPIIIDTLNWVKVSTVYKAQGGEQFITLGNFKKYTQTNYITANPTNPSYQTSYYFDDISIIPLDSFNLKADAGRDTTITTGDSAFIGSLTNGIDSIKWQVLNTNGVIDSIRPGFWVHPTVNTCYLVTQTVNGFTSSDTVCVTVNPLPLKFISFTATPPPPKEGNVKLDWQTANEINVSHFYVQRSTNGKDFVIIGKVNANGFSYNEYTFYDSPPVEGLGVVYYRIVSVDRDGKTSFSEVRQIIISKEQLAINIFPNPAKDFISVVGKSIKEIQIINQLGQVVYKEIATGTNLRNDATIINIKNFNKGLYVVKIVMKNGEVRNEKFVVE